MDRVNILQKASDSQADELSDTKRSLNEVNRALLELSYASKNPNLRFLFLRASLCRAQEQTIKAQNESEELRHIITAQQSQILELRSQLDSKITINTSDPVAEERLPGVLDLEKVLANNAHLYTQIIEMHGWVEKLHQASMFVRKDLSIVDADRKESVRMTSVTPADSFSPSIPWIKLKDYEDKINVQVGSSMKPPSKPDAIVSPSPKYPSAGGLPLSIAPDLTNTAPIITENSIREPTSTHNLLLERQHHNHKPGVPHSPSMLVVNEEDTNDCIPPLSTDRACSELQEFKTEIANLSLRLEHELAQEFQRVGRDTKDNTSPSSPKSSAKYNQRLKEWYEQQNGRLMAELTNERKQHGNMEKALQIAQREEERQRASARKYHTAAYRSSRAVDDLRRIVKLQRDRIAMMAGQQYMDVSPDKLIINNPGDDDEGDDDNEKLDMDTVYPPPYEEESAFHPQ